MSLSEVANFAFMKSASADPISELSYLVGSGVAGTEGALSLAIGSDLATASMVRATFAGF